MRRLCRCRYVGYPEDPLAELSQSRNQLAVSCTLCVAVAAQAVIGHPLNFGTAAVERLPVRKRQSTENHELRRFFGRIGIEASQFNGMASPFTQQRLHRVA
jgi:hypothetical protein